MIRDIRLRAGRGQPIEGFEWFTLAAGLLVPLGVIAIVGVLIQQAGPAISRFGLGFVVTRTWDPVRLNFGALTFIYGTVVSSAIALALALPIGAGVAIFLSEPRAGRIRGTIGIGVEMLAAIPSVVYGIWALFVMAPWVLQHIEEPLSTRFGFLPIFAGPARQTSMFTAALVVAVMVLPTLTAITREVIKGLPIGLREASFALGATWWETIRQVVLPAARAGIFGATVLALGRALAETIAVTMVIGNRPDIQASIFAPAYTLASVIANEFTEATGKLYSAALLELGLILMVVTLLMNLGALLLVRTVARDIAV